MRQFVELLFSYGRQGRFWLKIGFDVVAAIISLVLAFAIRLGGDFSPDYIQLAIICIPVSALICALTFYSFGMYRGLWRFASLGDLINIIKAVTVAQLIFVVTMFQFMRLETFPRSVVIIQWLLLVMLIGGARLSYRLLLNQFQLRNSNTQTQSIRRLLLVGTDETAELFIRSVTANLGWQHRIVGIIDGSDGKLVGRSIHGLRIVGRPDELEQVVTDLASRGQRPDTLVFSASVFEHKEDFFSDFARRAEQLGLHLTRLPRLADFRQQLEGGNLSPQPLTIEELLGRPQRSIDMDQVRQLVCGRRVLITGAGGSIGSELSRQIASFAPAHLVLLDHSEFNLYDIEQSLLRSAPTLSHTAVLADVRDRHRIERVFRQTQPNVVFHAAALKHVPMVERDPAEGILTNVIGTQNVADAARTTGVQAMVLISSDKAVNPTNVMGAAKRLAEYYCQANDLDEAQGANRCRFMTVRFGNVLGSSGSVVPLFRQQIAAGGPVTVTHPEMRRYFMSIPEAIGLVLQASAHGLESNAARGRIFVLDMGEPIKILDVARRMIRLARPDAVNQISIVFTGLRPGEKLYEELFNSNETASKTDVPGVLSATPCPIELPVLRRVLANLERAAHEGDAAAIIAILKAVVPGYRVSDNSTSVPPAPTSVALS